MANELAKYDAMRLAIDKATTIAEVKDIRDKAEAIRKYASQHGIEAHNRAAEIRLRAERRCGELLAEMKMNAGGQPRTANTTLAVLLRDVGVSHIQSSRWQSLARIPAETFEAEVAIIVDAKRELTTKHFLGLAKKLDRVETQNITCTTGDLDQLIQDGYRFGTIYVDPPWDYNNKATRAAASGHYETGSMEWLRALPVELLATEQAHLHLWTTNAFIAEAMTLIEAWGFEYKSCFVWVKPQMGIGNYWRVSHEFMLLGVRGGLTFDNHSEMSWATYPRQKHSAKPDQVRQKIESVSPGPRLEMFARTANEGWACWGNEISKDLFTQGIGELEKE